MTTKIIKSNLRKICKINSVKSEGSWVKVGIKPTVEEIKANPVLGNYQTLKNYIQNLEGVSFSTYFSDFSDDYSNCLGITLDLPEMFYCLTNSDWLNKHSDLFQDGGHMCNLYCDLYNSRYEKRATFITEHLEDFTKIYNSSK